MPKYQVTGWCPTAMYAMVEIEAANAQEAVEKGRDELPKADNFEYCDCSYDIDEIRAESDDARDTFSWCAPERDPRRQQAADAMLAALETTAFSLGGFYDESEDNAHNPTMQAVRRALEKAKTAIAAAKAAGITMKGE